MKNSYIFFSGQIDEHGNQVAKTKWEYPYSYDGFVTYRGGKNEDANSTIYSDRLMQQDYDKYNQLSQKHFGNEGQMFFDRSPKDIEAFLADWTGKKVKLILVMEYCNVSSGYPLWRFDFKSR